MTFDAEFSGNAVLEYTRECMKEEERGAEAIRNLARLILKNGVKH